MEMNLLYGIGFRLVLLDAEAKPVLEKLPFSYAVFLNRLSVLLHIEFGFQTEPSHKKSRQQSNEYRTRYDALMRSNDHSIRLLLLHSLQG